MSYPGPVPPIWSTDVTEDDRAVLERIFGGTNALLAPPYYGIYNYFVKSAGCTKRITMAWTAYSLNEQLVAVVHIVPGEALAIALLLPFDDAQLGLPGLCDMSHLQWGMLRLGTYIEGVESYAQALPLLRRAVQYAASQEPRSLRGCPRAYDRPPAPPADQRLGAGSPEPVRQVTRSERVLVEAGAPAAPGVQVAPTAARPHPPASRARQAIPSAPRPVNLRHG
jgi:hypothetical protein